MEEVRPVLSLIEKDFESAVSRYVEFLRIPSVSTDPAYKEHVRRAAQWLAQEFRSMGFDVALHETPGHPILLARHDATASGAPHLLYYGHYDVQPPEPLELWEHPPFEPAIVDGPYGKRAVARGAVDDKGQVMTFIEAFRAWKAVHNGFPVKLTVLIEGEEESGSLSLPAFLTAQASSLSEAGAAIITDTNAWDIDTPAITYRLRGNVYVEATLEGPNRDLHSGLYGGAVINPINALAEILGQLHDRDGRVQLPGFYDDVAELSVQERKAWADLSFDEGGFLGDIGLTQSVGEVGYTVLERLWARPTCDLNGIWGGYTGPGSKTVIASRASAKLSFRTVPRQSPTKILQSLKKFLDYRTPPDCKWRIEEFGASGGILVPVDSPFMQAARAGLEDVYKRPAAMVGTGGSIPVVGLLQKQLGLDSILVGFGLSDDRIHSPNEKFELKCLKNGILSQAAILG
ncbi:MAG TPA: M20/M25/M40 family metallo-hydrolase, partial [Hyphomicrobiales bacterium]|nr:M20/M25/M40 family metallo-hydrolase [Hyphomicrobiales bacterium]